MIVENKEATLNKANEISSKLLKIIIEDTKDFNCEDDPAEQIYLISHVIGNLLAKSCLSLEEYGKIYGIENLTYDSILEWITLITKEMIQVKNK